MKEVRLIGDEFLWVTGWQGVCRSLGQAKRGGGPKRITCQGSGGAVFLQLLKKYCGGSFVPRRYSSLKIAAWEQGFNS